MRVAGAWRRDEVGNVRRVWKGDKGSLSIRKSSRALLRSTCKITVSKMQSRILSMFQEYSFLIILLNCSKYLNF